MKSRGIDEEIFTTLDDDASGYSMVGLRLRQERGARFSEASHDLAEEPQVRETGRVILSALTTERFASVRDIARLTCLPPSTVHLNVTHSLRFTVRHLRSIPRLITNKQKHNRVTNSQALLDIH
jgi:hypothetical protein